eukprot:GFUD01000489.1.p1 GENE.GFUD01000489.1~~GFUD01000489.1.p1  ORF type:complete len:526 (+),score=117.42 GFUD01000489.1:104-1681(+)
MTTKVCFLCEIEDCKACSSCGLVASCTQHKNLHTSKDGSFCYPWTVQKREGVGRVLVAVRDIEHLEVILEDEPVGLSPTQDTPQMCLQCFKLIPDVNPFICLCGFPMCGEACAAGERHRPEHELYVAAGVQGRGIPDYPKVMPIRLLDQMEDNPTLKDRLGILMDHREERMAETNSWEITETHLVKPLKLLSGDKQWTSEDIQRCVGLFRTNGLALQATGLSPDQEWVDDDDLGNARALYPAMCALSHSCVPNCRVMHSLNYKLVIRSAKDIPAGEELTICYTKMFTGAISRKADLVNNWFFECQCQRCRSRLDFDSNFDCWICQECGGSVLPQNESLSSDWQCGGCCNVLSRMKIKDQEILTKNILDHIQENKEMDSVQLYEDFLESQKSTLHSGHFLNMQAKLNLMFAFTNAVTETELERKLEVCRDVIDMLDTLKLGYIEVRGLALYDLCVPSLVLLKGKFDAGIISREQFKDGLDTVTKNLESSIECLEVEEKGTYRKLIAERATHILHNVKELVLFIDFL